MNKTVSSSDGPLDEIVLSDLLQCLVECSEKSSKIAQIFREENDVFNLLIQEKSESESNKRFVQDFKTLADVLVQETIKLDVSKKFPRLVPKIQGEEQISFKNAQGESIEVILTDSADETTSLLSKVLDGRKNFARAIANVLHSTEILCEKKQCFAADTYPIDKLGIWIDPIDSIAEFIEGKCEESETEGTEQNNGLKCVCVLIGAYDLETYVPVIGVVNQPFHSRSSENAKWKSKFFWGIHYKNSSIVSSSVQSTPNDHNASVKEDSDLHPDKDKTVLTSSSESIELLEIIKRQYKVVHSAGAGHKALLVAIKKSDLYILSKSSTYFWDTCGPHAILMAAGGGMLRLKEAINDCDEVNMEFLKRRQVKYKPVSSKTGTEAFQNLDGILAYRDPNIALNFVRFLKNSGYVVR
ncbi:inositol polyphosphate 1-phosphatase [Parasteatoda tepidariorum]|uniref:inositol polyphosphate 1-phosphatase n=1 Tax=Parasteatoda tepidariorum TaxID=114398 RepID=UPI001C71BBAF|nr:inositol polyphosphate 1-phosphatase [Parasteatoda tepidariorum]XP_015907307.2 inositol polyphosphate 1-phosphatase [Parasteatoda tepidariorum]XP_015907308.2 inositol polyphosphate 1-phosphatase [Parasteatoda tepidariorum]XP_015907309.2 inositol polyphosphate 1-phosphatase [Parasteatoda tepidariorum]XP_015907310.2 inositol polyphosphate 1-phosphatase [Parasteatoda tepidariorum]XP_015907311.2 inositol polyphosphate 1-phosphatase [Parasteatoda tepidariorum]XP_015907312.2 inositol polyphospha